MSEWKHRDKPGGWRLSIKDTGKGWRVIVANEGQRRAYVAEPDAYMDDAPMAWKWAHIVYQEMTGKR